MKRFFSDLKIKQKIQLFAIGALLLLCVIFLLFYGQVASNTVLRRARETAQDNLRQIESYMNEVNIAVSSRLSHLGTSITVQQTMELAEQGRLGEADWSVNALLRDIQSAEQIGNVELYTLDGTFVAGTETERENGWSPARNALAAACAIPESNYWHDDETYRNARTDSVSIYRAICTEADGIIGIARVELSTAALSNMYSYVGFSGLADIYLFSGRGNVMLPRETTPGVLRVGRDRFEDDAAEQPCEEETYRFQNQRYLVKSLPLEQYDLYVVSIASYARLMEDVRTLQMTILLLGLVCVIVQLVLFSFMGGLLSRPIMDLSEKMRQVGDGNLDLRNNSTGKDEIGVLSRSFDRMLDRIQQLMEENAAGEKRRHELELISLQTQITPHFLYNSLDSVSALVQLGDTEGAFQMSKALGGFYRGVLSDGRSVISVEEELRMTDSYLQVQSQRYRDGFDYRIDMAPETLHASIVKLTIQPLVENAIYHGIRCVRRRGLITITGRVEHGEMVLSVWDNGKGMAAGTTAISENHKKGDLILHRKGYGMYNADQRIKLYFGSQYGLRVESEPEAWTKVEVRVPLCPYKEYQHDFGFDRR